MYMYYSAVPQGYLLKCSDPCYRYSFAIFSNRKETIHERRCVSVQRERCEATGQTLRRKVVVEEEECTTEFREHCMEPVIDFYVFIQGRCETLPEKKCKVVRA